MSIVTELKIGGARSNKVTVIFDDLSTLDISREALEESGIYTGLAMSSQQIQELEQQDRYFSCLNAALHFLAHRQRSKREVEIRMRQRSFPRETIERVLIKLEEKKLLDDAEFARAWTENRKTFSPRSRFLIRQELKLKGINGDMLDETTADLDDNESAFQAGLKKSRLLKSLPRDEFGIKLSRFLHAKGFSYSVVENAVERLWQVSQKANNSDEVSSPH